MLYRPNTVTHWTVTCAVSLSVSSTVGRGVLFPEAPEREDILLYSQVHLFSFMRKLWRYFGLLDSLCSNVLEVSVGVILC